VERISPTYLSCTAENPNSRVYNIVEAARSDRDTSIAETLGRKLGPRFSIRADQHKGRCV